jgi:hypothetical protein
LCKFNVIYRELFTIKYAPNVALVLRNNRNGSILDLASKITTTKHSALVLNNAGAGHMLYLLSLPALVTVTFPNFTGREKT